MILLPPRSTLFPYTTLFRSKSNSTSAANVTFSATGLGFSGAGFGASAGFGAGGGGGFGAGDRKSTRLNSSHSQISYAVFCLKKKKAKYTQKKLSLRHASNHE